MKIYLPLFCSLFSFAVSAIEFSIPSSPVRFLENRGQWDPEILYKGVSTSTSVYLLTDGLSFAQAEEREENEQGREVLAFHVWNMKFLNTQKSMRVEGSGGAESKVSFLSGADNSRWVIHPGEYAQINYSGIYKNIDLVIYGNEQDLKYDYTVHAGGDLQSIRSGYSGVEKLMVNDAGELEIDIGGSRQKQHVPVAWQVIHGKRQPVVMRYVLLNDTSFGFDAPEGYDRNADLIIDPLFEMVWSSYTQIPGGSNNMNYCFSNGMDPEGNVYLTGMVDGTFPITPGAYSGPGNVYPEVFVAKFSADGTTLIYWTYLPGNSSEHGTGIVADSLGRAFVTGIVELNFTGITNFPSTANAYQPVHDTGSDAFLTVLNPNGTALVYSSFLGGTGSETGYGISLGGPEIVYITGTTSIGNFPTKSTAAFPTGDLDVFVAKFDISQSGNNSLVYSTRIGGGSFSQCRSRSIAVNSAGNVFITGSISSSFGTPVYPTTPGVYNSVYNPGLDGAMSFVTKLSANTPVALDYSTFLAPGTGSAIAVDAITGDAFVVGSVYSFTFPVTPGALQPVHAGAGGTDAFAIRLNATGSALVYSTFLGGYWGDSGTGVAVNSAGEAYVSGISQDSFPTSAGAFQPANAGTYDFFVVHLNAGGTGYGCGGSTYVGGSDADYSGSFYDYPSPHVTLRDHGGNNDTICISSTSHSQDFPTTPGAYGPVKVNGIADQPVFFKMTCLNTALPVAAFSAPNTICPGTCTGFTNLSQNSTSFLWSFPGASIPTSTDVNPSGICYNMPGSYDVMLVASNVNGNDTLVLSNYISVYPFPPPQGIQQNGDTLAANPGAVGYQWYFNGNPIPGATGYFYVAQESGDYNVVATDANGCEVEAAIFNVVAGIGSGKGNEGAALYPVPVGDRLTVVSSDFENNSPVINIYDITGKAIMEKQLPVHFEGHKAEIDVSGLASGFYWLSLSGGKQHDRCKFIKE